MTQPITLTATQLAQMIDISAVQAFHTRADLEALVEIAKEYKFAAVHALPNWTSTLAGMLSDTPDVLVGGPVGFPGGGHKTETKIFEAQSMLADGVQEMDMMINVSRLKSGDLDYVTREIAAVVAAAGDVGVKVILETAYLTHEEIRAGSIAAADAGAAFVKTSTGWAPGGARVEDIRIIADAVQGKAKIKASGGIRDLATVREMILLGVDRFGINADASRQIIAACEALPGGVLEVADAA